MIDQRQEQALARVELVGGIGTRESGRLCVMSLVAWLADEPHGDSPATASPLVRAFAIPLNDGMPPLMRQRLKLFAPRILGTADGRDADRARLLRAAMDALVPWLAARSGGTLRQLWGRFRLRRLEREARGLLARAGTLQDAGDLACAAAAAGAMARLLASAARDTGETAEAARVWALGLMLLDALCDRRAGTAETVAVIRLVQLA